MHTLKTNRLLVNLHSTLNLCCWWAGEALLQFSRISSAFSSPAVFILLLNSLFTCCALEFFSSVSPGHIPHGGLAVWVWSLWLCLYTPRQTASVHAHQQYVVAVSSLFMYARAHVWWVQWRVHVSVRAHVWADCGDIWFISVSLHPISWERVSHSRWSSTWLDWLIWTVPENCPCLPPQMRAQAWASHRCWDSWRSSSCLHSYFSAPAFCPS